MLWLIDYESSQWCGGSSHVVVVADSEDEALELAELHMEESMRELFSSEYEDDANEGGNADEECAYTVNSCEPFDETHEDWQFYTNPSQEQFYPTIGKF